MPDPMLYADITGPIVDFCVNVIESAGLAGVFLLMAAGSACIPIPSEAVMLFAGFNVSSGDQTLVGITLAGLAGNMAGSWLTYAIGYYGRIDLLEKNRLIHLSPSRLAWVDSWFRATATPPSSSPACCRWCGPSSRSRPAWQRCRSGGSPG